MTIVLLDGLGNFDVFVVLQTDGVSATVRWLPGGTGAAYASGVAVLPVQLRTTYWNADLASCARTAATAPIFPSSTTLSICRSSISAIHRRPLRPTPAFGTGILSVQTRQGCAADVASRAGRRDDGGAGAGNFRGWSLVRVGR